MGGNARAILMKIDNPKKKAPPVKRRSVLDVDKFNFTAPDQAAVEDNTATERGLTLEGYQKQNPTTKGLWGVTKDIRDKLNSGADTTLTKRQILASSAGVRPEYVERSFPNYPKDDLDKEVEFVPFTPDERRTATVDYDNMDQAYRGKVAAGTALTDENGQGRIAINTPQPSEVYFHEMQHTLAGAKSKTPHKALFRSQAYNANMEEIRANVGEEFLPFPKDFNKARQVLGVLSNSEKRYRREWNPEHPLQNTEEIADNAKRNRALQDYLRKIENVMRFSPDQDPEMVNYEVGTTAALDRLYPMMIGDER